MYSYIQGVKLQGSWFEEKVSSVFSMNWCFSVPDEITWASSDHAVASSDNGTQSEHKTDALMFK
jgi:hypothetical protein